MRTHSAIGNRIETLLFDFGGTLDANGVAWKERFYSHYRAEGLDMTPDAFQPCFFAADSSLVGKLPIETDLSATVHAVTANLEIELARVAAGSGDRQRSERVAARFLSQASAAFARNRPVLEALRQRYRLGVVSNFYGNLQAVCQSANLASLFLVLVDSHVVGAEKPDPAIFHAALDALGASPERTALVGDSLRRDREGARRTGMGFIWMMTEGIDCEEHTSVEPDADYRIAQLPDLMRVLQ
jgi:HAD superfamily hydrolase (TIGR01549 family)